MFNKILIFGAGPSLAQNIKDYIRLGPFPGVTIACDAAVEKLLQHDIIPDYCTVLEDGNDLDKYFRPKIVQQKGHLIKKCYVSDRISFPVKESLGEAKISWEIAPNCGDYFNTSNVGLFTWFVSIHSLDIKEIYLLGMDHCYAKDAPPPVDQKSELFKYGFYVVWDPHNDEKMILNPAHQLWKEEFEYFSKQYPEVKNINLTGRGALCKDKYFEWKPISNLNSWQ